MFRAQRFIYGKLFIYFIVLYWHSGAGRKKAAGLSGRAALFVSATGTAAWRGVRRFSREG
jgi:hypothetical protein